MTTAKDSKDAKAIILRNIIHASIVELHMLNVEDVGELCVDVCWLWMETQLGASGPRELALERAIAHALVAKRGERRGDFNAEGNVE